jgi:hypothetical protein
MYWLNAERAVNAVVITLAPTNLTIIQLYKKKRYGTFIRLFIRKSLHSKGKEHA